MESNAIQKAVRTSKECTDGIPLFDFILKIILSGNRLSGRYNITFASSESQCFDKDFIPILTICTSHLYNILVFPKYGFFFASARATVCCGVSIIYKRQVVNNITFTDNDTLWI